MAILLSSRNGDMFYGIQHLYRLPPGSKIYHTENHLHFKEVVEWISPGRFHWEQVNEAQYFEYKKQSLGHERGDYSSPVYVGPQEFSVVDMSNNTLSLVDKTREAFRKAIPCGGPLFIFPTAKSSRKELPLELLREIRWPRDTIICAEENKSTIYCKLGLPVISKHLTELISMQPRAVVGACSFPVLLFSWLGVRSLKVHVHPFTRPPRAPIDHLGGKELDADPSLINGWISELHVTYL